MCHKDSLRNEDAQIKPGKGFNLNICRKSLKILRQVIKKANQIKLLVNFYLISLYYKELFCTFAKN
jgi:hypothetical protein